MKRILYSTLILCVFTFCNTHCKKHHPEPVKDCDSVVTAPQAFLDYWYFPVGSWWVYKLQGTTNVYDTVKVTAASSRFNQPYQPGYGIGACEMLYDFHMSHSNQTFFPGYPLLGIEDMGTKHDTYTGKWYMQQVSEVNNLCGLDLVFEYPFSINDTVLGGCIIKDTNAIVTPMMSFNNTFHITSNYGSPGDSTLCDHIKDYYFTRKTGITKAVYTHNHTWELINYHIN